jgi:2-phospho-L-lactate guanylyltransferase
MRPSSPAGSLSVIVPLRGRTLSKTRLAGRFSEDLRARLILGMGQNVLDAVIGSDVASQILLVTRDPVFAQQVIGDRIGIRIIHQTSRFAGLLGAIDLGRDSALSTTTLVLFADLPAVSPADVQGIAADPHRVVVAPDRHHQGSNAVLVRDDPDGEFRFRFGEGSFERHISEAASLGWEPGVVDRPGLALDLDTIDDWVDLPIRLRDELLRDGDTDVVPSASMT